MRDFSFYYGAAAGSDRKALQRLEEPNVMINSQTHLNQPWPEIESLFIDSGGAPDTILKHKGYPTTNEEYLDYIQDVQPDYYVLRDYPCEPDVLQELGNTVYEHQVKTLTDHIDLLDQHEDSDIQAQPVTVIQGWREEDYLKNIQQHREQDTLTDYVAIGSICRRDTALATRIIQVVSNELPNRDIHGFGVKRTILENPSVVQYLTSADSLAYSYACRREQDRSDNWLEKAYHYLHFKRQIEERLNYIDESQTQLQLVGEDRAGGEQ